MAGHNKQTALTLFLGLWSLVATAIALFVAYNPVDSLNVDLWQADHDHSASQPVQHDEEHIQSVETSGRKPKRNMVFMVSDGMGPHSLSMARSFNQHMEGLDPLWTMHLDDHFIGNSRTRSSDSLVTDSAAGATAFACGLKTYNGAIGVDPDSTPCGTVLEAAKKAGFHTGLVVTTRITDATPASFAAHVSYRSKEDEIAQQLLGENHLLGMDPVDLMIGGGRCHFMPRSHGGCRSDKRNLIEEAKDHGWSYVANRAQFDELENGTNVTLPLLALMAQGDIPFDIDRIPEQYPSLAEFARTALTALSEATKDSEQGFFLLIEGSRIDHAGHQNDPGAQVREVLAYNEAFQVVTDFINESDVETVVLSTSDHETGGLSTARQVSDSYPDYLWYPEVLGNATHSTEFLASRLARFEARSKGKSGHKELVKFVRHNVLGPEGLNLPVIHDHDVKAILKHRENAQDLLAELLSIQAQIGWSTHGHSAVDVNVYAHAKDPRILDTVRGDNENIDFTDFMSKFLGVELSTVDWGHHHSSSE